jgi:hypothetical protein
MQLVDRSACASKKGVAVWGRNDTLRTSVKKPRADSMLKVGNHLRDRRRIEDEVLAWLRVRIEKRPTPNAC